MTLFRSEKMTLCQMLLHTETAFDCLTELGYMGAVQFNNLNDFEHVVNYKFAAELQRSSELGRILKYLQDEFEEWEIKCEHVNYDEFFKPEMKDLNEIGTALTHFYKELTNIAQNYDNLYGQYQTLTERLHVLNKADDFFRGDRKAESALAWSDSTIMALIRDHSRGVKVSKTGRVKLGFFTGAIAAERFNSFELMLWRVSRGNFFMRHDEIPVLLVDMSTQNTKQMVPKYAFILFFQGNAMHDKIIKICQGFRAKLYECPESREDRRIKRNQLIAEMADINLVLKETNEHRLKVLNVAATDFDLWRNKIQNITMIYFTLNKLSPVRGVDNQKYLEAECWIPTDDLPRVRRALLMGAKRSARGTSMLFPPFVTEKDQTGDTNKKQPPTYFRLNRFTCCFQNLIDSYGVANYQELNPAPYTIVTFPFLFAVMFGDIGHGMIMAIFAYWMISREKSLESKNEYDKKPSEIWNLLFAGRYVIFLMGIFSIYTGMIYNDIFSKSLNIFGSSWVIHYNISTVEENKYLQLDPATTDYIGTPYIFGMDPVWDATQENAIITYNSLKMKLAIILGVIHMLFGLILSIQNHRYAQNSVDLVLVSLPQIIFLVCIFFYLAFLIFFKWVHYGGHKPRPHTSDCAPSILITFINMILMKAPRPAEGDCLNYMYRGQRSFEMFILSVALICIPILLAGKPIYFMIENKRIRNLRESRDLESNLKSRTSFFRETLRKSLVYNVQYNEDAEAKRAEEAEHEIVNVSELWIHQGIHCIESILGSVSHTASYLRLWALSLAHDQLSTVLWNMVLAKPLIMGDSYSYSIFLYFSFWFWALLTVAILVVMEGLSAFLHTLRLHWVEFQSKFYSGQGEKFYPFRFKDTPEAA